MPDKLVTCTTETIPDPPQGLKVSHANQPIEPILTKMFHEIYIYRTSPYEDVPHIHVSCSIVRTGLIYHQEIFFPNCAVFIIHA